MLTRVLGSRLIRRPQGFHEGNQLRHLRGPQILAVRRHVSATLDNLPNELIARKARGHRIQCGAAHPTLAIERVTISALLALDENRASKFERGPPLHINSRGGRAAPSLHVWRPGREGSRVRQQPYCC